MPRLKDRCQRSGSRASVPWCCLAGPVTHLFRGNPDDGTIFFCGMGKKGASRAYLPSVWLVCMVIARGESARGHGADVHLSYPQVFGPALLATYKDHPRKFSKSRKLLYLPGRSWAPGRLSLAARPRSPPTNSNGKEAQYVPDASQSKGQVGSESRRAKIRYPQYQTGQAASGSTGNRAGDGASEPGQVVCEGVGWPGGLAERWWDAGGEGPGGDVARGRQTEASRRASVTSRTSGGAGSSVLPGSVAATATCACCSLPQ